MSNKNNGDQNSQSAKVLKLGLNISVSGEPGTDFEIVLNDKEQKAIKLSSEDEKQFQALDALQIGNSITDVPRHELEKKSIQEVSHAESAGAIPRHRNKFKNTDSSESSKMSGLEKEESSNFQDKSLISQIKSTMEHFEKFSDHIKEIPRLKNCPIATSTPFSDKYNSKSESNLVYPEFQPRKYSFHLYDFNSRKDYFKSSVKSASSDLFLKPLPGEGYYKRAIYSRYYDLEPYRHYSSDNSLNKTSDYKNIYLKANYDVDKYEGYNLPPEPPSGILKKSDSESGDKLSTSSADSIKDIKIYQSGGILIMQNFKDSMDVMEKKEISEFSAKLIENCNKLKMEVNNFKEDKPEIGNSFDVNKNTGKMVQFDLSSFESRKSKECDSSFNAFKEESSNKMESSESVSDYLKNKDISPQGTTHSQDYPSLSTQENDSILSNQPGTSPTYASSKKLEWDSGADIGYLNLDPTKENLSTIEKIVLKGLSNDGLSEKHVVYEKQNQGPRSKFMLERKPSDLVVEEAMNELTESKDERESDIFKGSKKEKKCYTEEQTVKISSERGTKDEHTPKFEETKPPSNRNSDCATKRNEFQSKEKVLELTDKSLNVKNTLIGNVNWHSSFNQRHLNEFKKPLESPAKPKLKKSPKFGLSKNKKPSPRKPFKTPKKAPISCISAKLSDSALNMGIPKKVYKKVEATPALNDVELSREVEEIIIDHRFKIKQNKTSRSAPDREVKKDFDISVKEKPDSTKVIKTKNKPISASSSSNNTILPKFENRENVEEKSEETLERCKFTDQIIQTSDYDRESIGIQAFASQVSSDCDFKSSKKIEVPKLSTKEDRANVNTSSKNIQAFGLTSSLPKQLEHSKEVELVDNHHTKSTQFFGGPISSLPNYHSNLVIKPGESCDREPNILKTRKNSEAEIIRLKEENEKNILANDAPTLAEIKRFPDSPRHCSNENKENFINQNSTYSKKSQSDGSHKKLKENASQDSDKKENDQKKKLVESPDSHRISDEVSSVVLTSEILKVHGDSIDRNIIQEKYFESQLVELEKRKMISRSTSMEIQLQLEDGEAGKEYKTIGCQYSVQSRGTISEGNYQDTGDESFKENQNKKSWRRRRLEQYGSRQNLTEDYFETSKSINQVQGLGAGDSLPSSTQTAHSWIPGIPNSRENTTGVDKARSFEYLPGHIYKSSDNLKEIPNEMQKNLISSSYNSDTSKDSVSDGGAQDSEGRNTLVLENSTECSHESDRLKILDENLAQLNFAVLKLWEKDAQMQSVTQSLLANLWKKSGSGDFSALGGVGISKTKVIETKDLLVNGKIRSDGLSEVHEQEPEKEFSIACQTEGKSPSDPEKFYEEKKVLEKRISEEKKNQIKWIENEIHHLNILRNLLEKQNSPVQRKKKLSPLTITSDDDFKSEVNYFKKPSKEVHSREATPVYGCTISVMENPTEKDQPAFEENNCEPRGKQHYPAQYGMAVSLSGCPKNWKPLVMLPLDVQVSLKNSDLLKDCINKDVEKETHSHCRHHTSKSSKSNSIFQQQKPIMPDINTQYPSARRTPVNIPSTSIQTDFQPPERSNQCSQENCFCINLSQNGSPTASHTSRSTNRTSEKIESSKLRFSTEKSCIGSGSKTNNTTEPELAEMESYPVSKTEKKTVKNSVESDLSGNYAKYKSIQPAICKRQKAVDKANSFGSFTKQISVQGTGCKCQNYPKQLSSSTSKSATICKNLCQSDIYLNCEKPSEDVGLCRCSKIQVQKSAYCTCHIIKIHGSKCCSSERSPCSCKKRNIMKKTENQYCQTDCGPLEVKNLCESKNTVERKKQVSEKLLCDTKVAYEKMHQKSAKLQLLEKRALEKKTPEGVVPARIKSPLPSCSCKRKAEKEKTEVDDHPRHYFLRIEETEVDDSCERINQKKSLDVITVTVPVKKAGKGKIYNNKYQTCINQKSAKPLVDVPSKGCNCCEECIENSKVPEQNYDPCISSDYRACRAEKSESPTRNSELLNPPETSSSGDLSFYPCEELPQFSFSQKYFQSRNGLTQIEPSYSQKPVRDNYEPQCCEGCNCINRNSFSKGIKTEYEGYKKGKNSNVREYYDGGTARFYDINHKERISQNCTPLHDTEPCTNDWSAKSNHSGPRKLNAENDQYSPDYYNYNKREFMTKSEILKEEEQKRKVHQPTLQECLSSNRPDFYDSAERRRQIITERAKERVKKYNSRMDCLLKMVQQCNKKEESNAGRKKIFTTVQMREQTMKRYKKLPEVTGKIADQKKKEEYRTNKLMADIFAKKLQIEALKGKHYACKYENR